MFINIGISLLIFIQYQSTIGKELVQCRAWGDPHIIPFSANKTDFPREIWCKHSGLMWFLKNKYILSTILINPTYFFITDFNFVFLDDNGLVQCTIDGKDVLHKSLPNCITHGIKLYINDETVMITYEKAEFIALITVDDTSKPAYSITVWLDPCLAKVSDGMCKSGCSSTSTDCLTAEKNSIPATDTIQKNVQNNADEICSVYIKHIVDKFNLNPNDKTNNQVIEIENAKNACISDLTLTGDIKIASASMFNLAPFKLTLNFSTFHNLEMNLTLNLKYTLDMMRTAFTEFKTNITHIIDHSTHQISLKNNTVVYLQLLDSKNDKRWLSASQDGVYLTSTKSQMSNHWFVHTHSYVPLIISLRCLDYKNTKQGWLTLMNNNEVKLVDSKWHQGAQWIVTCNENQSSCLLKNRQGNEETYLSGFTDTGVVQVIHALNNTSNHYISVYWQMSLRE